VHPSLSSCAQLARETHYNKAELARLEAADAAEKESSAVAAAASPMG